METLAACAVCAQECSPNPHCRDCHRTWTRHSEAHCTVCHAHFSSDDAFDRHLAPVRSDDLCYPPETILKQDGTPVLEVM